MSSNGTSPSGVAAGPDPSLPHDNMQAGIISCILITWLIALVFVWARFYTRINISRAKLNASEWFLMLSLLFSLATSICQIVEVEFGMGMHIWDLTAMNSNMVGASEAGWFAIVFYGLSLAFAKVSILLLFITVFLYSWVQIASWIVLAAVFVSNVWIYYVIFSACTPLPSYWDFTITPVACQPQSHWLANQILLIITDFMIFFLPIPAVWGLTMKWQQKIVLIALFASGFFVCLISILRLAILNPTFISAGADISYNITPIFYWTCVEMNLAIVVASSITLRPLFAHLVPKVFSSDQTPSKGSSPSSGPYNAIATIGSGRTKGLQRHAGIDEEMAAEAKEGADIDLELGDLGSSGSFKPSSQETKLSETVEMPVKK